MFKSLKKLFRGSYTTGGSLTDPTSDFWYTLIGEGGNSAGVKVNQRNAMQLAAVASCVTLISGDFARLPLILYQRMPDGSRRRAIEHPKYDLMHTAPNKLMPAHTFKEIGVGHNLLWGNFYALKDQNRFTGDIRALLPIDSPGSVQIKRKGNTKLFTWYDKDMKKQVHPAKDMLHIPSFGYDGLKGQSLISFARESIGLGIAAEKFGGRFFSNGTHPSMVVEFPPEGSGMEDEEVSKAYTKKLNEKSKGLHKSHDVLVLHNGEKIRPLTMPLNDAQFLETRDYQKSDIASIFHVPVHKLSLHGQNTNNNNIEQENQGYLDSCLTHWTTRWEQWLNFSILDDEERAEGFFYEFLLAGFLRGDMAARSEYYRTLFNMGFPLNRILAKENENPVDGGDQGYIPLNMIPLDRADDLAVSNINDGKAPNDGRSVRSENRGVQVRDRIVSRYLPLIKRAAEDIIKLEASAVRAEIGRLRSQRATPDMDKWLEQFYGELPGQIRDLIAPTMTSFAEAIRDASAQEIGVEADDHDIQRFARDYVETYIRRHISSSQGQLEALTDFESIEERVSEWAETRADKIARNETTRLSNAVFQSVVFAVGMRTVWRIRGEHTCPYCRSLNGNTVSQGQLFVQNGQELGPEGVDEPMKIRGSKAHPPLHQGCDCYLTAV